MKIHLIDCMGNDLTVVNAAKASFNKISDEFNEKEHTRLIKYLANHKHWTPFGHPQLQFIIEAPLFIRSQWFRHTIGLVRNEVSRRYVSDRPKYWIPDGGMFRKKPEENIKQGSSHELLKDPYMETLYSGESKVFHRFHDICDLAVDYYEFMLEEGICPEQARAVLPVGTYTSWYETGSLFAYARIAELRLHPHAQKEIRDLAEQLNDIMKDLFPVSWEALTSVKIHTKEI